MTDNVQSFTPQPTYQLWNTVNTSKFMCNRNTVEKQQSSQLCTLVINNTFVNYKDKKECERVFQTLRKEMCG